MAGTNLLLQYPMPATLVRDAFFDGPSDGTGKVKDKCSTPDGSKYHDPSSQRTAIDGNSLASRMPSGRHSSRGVVIPHANRHGISSGWDPHHPPHQRVIIDPDIGGASLEIDLASVGKAMAADAFRAADRIVPHVGSVEDERFRASAFFHVLAQQQGVGRALSTKAELDAAHVGSAPGITPPPDPIAAPAPSMNEAAFKQALAEASPATTIHAASFSAPSAPQPAPPPPPAAAYAPPASAPAPNQGGLLSAMRGAQATASVAAPMTATGVVEAPQVRVTFGLPVGDYEAYFHGAVANGNTLALVYDDRYRGGGRFFPNPLDEPFAVAVEGHPTVYLVESTGMSYRYDERTHYVLLVVQATAAGRVGR